MEPMRASTLFGATVLLACGLGTPARASFHVCNKTPLPTRVALGRFDGSQLRHDDIVSTFFQRDGRYWVRTDGPDGALADFEVRDTFGVSPLQQYLIELPNGRYGWRVSMPAMMSYWSELAREIVLPPAGTATTLVRAKRTSPPYVGDRLIAGLRDRLGPDFELLDFDCNHMVPYAKPDEVAALTRELLEAR